MLKSEPDAYRYSCLKNAPNRRTLWEGMRNYQAGNLLRNEFRPGNLAYF
ncbi:EVE domain-containing protein [Bacterioplanoides sp. SCSIO 12839]|nr:EVE domain-containing protein [Bacterioplanoides sp. SCSIO 12839]